MLDVSTGEFLTTEIDEPGLGQEQGTVSLTFAWLDRDAVAGEWLTNTARFAIVRSGDTNPAVTVNYSISGSASASRSRARS